MSKLKALSLGEFVKWEEGDVHNSFEVTEGPEYLTLELKDEHGCDIRVQLSHAYIARRFHGEDTIFAAFAAFAKTLNDYGPYWPGRPKPE